MRRRILANRTRGAATSASWNTTYQPWRRIRAPILTKVSVPRRALLSSVGWVLGISMSRTMSWAGLRA